MKLLDFLILIVLFALLGLGVYVLWLNLPGESVIYEPFQLNASKYVYSDGTQFYSNMRYKDKRISYSISDVCDANKKEDVGEAFSLISEKTILEFYNSKEGEIEVLCSNIAPRPEEEGHFVAGEGGPSEIINTTNFAVILSGKVSLFRQNECKKPNVALHEILHSLGFDHNTNQKSIMYPVTKCDQEMDNYIANEINRLYSIDSAADLAVEQVSANKTGAYLNFEIKIANVGVQDSESSELLVYADNKLVKEYPLELIEIGTRKILSVYNLKVARSAEFITFEVKNNDKELDSSDNKVEMRLVRVS